MDKQNPNNINLSDGNGDVPQQEEQVVTTQNLAADKAEIKKVVKKEVKKEVEKAVADVVSQVVQEIKDNELPILPQNGEGNAAARDERQEEIAQAAAGAVAEAKAEAQCRAEEAHKDGDCIDESKAQTEVDAENTQTCADQKQACADDFVDAQKSAAAEPWYMRAPKKKQSFSEVISKSPKVYVAIIVIFTSFLRAIAMNVFVVPNKIAPGGVIGIASILENALGWNAAVMNFVLNIPLFILAFFYINKKFTILTAVATGLTSLFMEYIKMPVFVGDMFVAALVSGILNGVSLGLLLKVNSSTGGTDIIGLLIQNKMPDAKVIWIIFFFNTLVAVASGIVFKSLALVIYAMVSVFASSYSGEVMQKGFVSTFEITIVTKHVREISDYIMHVMHRGVTAIPAVGMFTGESVSYLITIVRKRQVNELKKVIQAIDPHSFFYVTSINDTIGKGFDNRVTPSSRLNKDKHL